MPDNAGAPSITKASRDLENRRRCRETPRSAAQWHFPIRRAWVAPLVISRAGNLRVATRPQAHYWVNDQSATSTTSCAYLEKRKGFEDGLIRTPSTPDLVARGKQYIRNRCAGWVALLRNGPAVNLKTHARTRDIEILQWKRVRRTQRRTAIMRSRCLGSFWTQARVPLLWRQSGANHGLGETRCSHLFPGSILPSFLLCCIEDSRGQETRQKGLRSDGYTYRNHAAQAKEKPSFLRTAALLSVYTIQIPAAICAVSILLQPGC